MRRMAGLKEELESWIGLESRASDLDELLALALAERDESLISALSEEVAELGSTLEELEFRLILSPASTTTTTPSRTSRWRRAEWIHRTGRRCSCGCISVGGAQGIQCRGSGRVLR